MAKSIISRAVTGSVHTPSMSPHLPVTSEAGAAIVHLHARAPRDGRPDQTPEAFAPFLKTSKQRPNVVLNLTIGGSPLRTLAAAMGGSVRVAV